MFLCTSVILNILPCNVFVVSQLLGICPNVLLERVDRKMMLAAVWEVAVTAAVWKVAATV